MTSDASPALIAVDWGTSALRAWLLDRNGRILHRAHSSQGIMNVERGRFGAVFEAITGGWREETPRLPAIAAGMVGSSEGWIAAPYVACPAGPGDLASALVPLLDADLWVVPGVMQTGAAANVMRGEETQIAGALALRPDLAGRARLVLPGTHSKWVKVADGRIQAFATHMTGELFAVLRSHSILGRFARDAAPVPDAASGGAAFLRGVDAARAAAGVSPLLFSARSLVLTGQLAPGDSLDYLSGLLIGEELRSALGERSEPLLLIGEPALCARYTLALARFGLTDVSEIADAAVAGLWHIAAAARLLDGATRERAR